MKEPNEWLTIPQAAALSNRTPAAIYKWIQRGKLRAYPSLDRGSLVRSIDIDELDQTTRRSGGRPRGSRNTPTL